MTRRSFLYGIGGITALLGLGCLSFAPKGGIEQRCLRTLYSLVPSSSGRPFSTGGRAFSPSYMM
ncbi:twin-arginine translocation signal domain-containing protein [Eggerthellaceae bacterium zg-893]|nr:twin-arginine translocation signal domain-containing protein [Eggerthellaceae bacterium zg-893]